MKLYSKSGKYSGSKSNTPKRTSATKSEAAYIQQVSRHWEEMQLEEAANVQSDLERRAEARRAAASQQKKTKTDLRTLVQAAAIFCAIMLATLIFLGVRSAVSANDFRKLHKQLKENESQITATEAPTGIGVTLPTLGENQDGETVPLETLPPVKTMMAKYVDLYESNPDMFGWVRIDDTVLDYPVMLCEEENERYLYANFEGKYRFTGLPFADNQCTADSDNIVIFGHNIKDGSMFRSLFKYEKESYWEKHPTIMFSDLYEDYEYEVMSVFYDRVYKKTDNVFKFYQFIDADTEAEFDYAIDQLKSKSLYDTGVDAQYGDKLITLVTCSYQVENGRFVVVARRK